MRNLARGILMTGFFRTGSTFVFSALRSDSRFCSYYEPYHPMLEGYLAQDRLGMPAADAAFLGHTVDGDYFAEYRCLDQRQLLSCLKINDRLTDHPVLGEASRGQDLKGYIDFLIDAAIDAGKIPFLQCNRWNFVLPWLKNRYPDYAIVLITRSSISVALSLYGLARKEGKKLDLLSPHADYWGVAETSGNIASYYGFDGDDVGQLNYFQKVHFIIRFAEHYMSLYSDFTLNYDNFGSEGGAFFHALGDRLGVDLQPSRDYLARYWRREKDKVRIANSVANYLERPEAILRAWGEEQTRGV
jgi:hypothetical protein